jgi:hypothetical protein
VEPEPAAAVQASPAVAVTEIEPVVLLPDGDALVGLKLSDRSGASVMVNTCAAAPLGVIVMVVCRELAVVLALTE